LLKPGHLLLVQILLLGHLRVLHAENAIEIVRQAVQTELAAARDDHSRWLYYEVERKPEGTLKQWVADTANGSLRRIMVEDGHPLSRSEQRHKMDGFVLDTDAQARQRKSGHRDDLQAAEMLSLLPNAFEWSITGAHAGATRLHFTPAPNFHAPDWETRVFAAMEGDMEVDDAQHRIVSLKGRLIHDVKFFYGVFGNLRAGGTFDVERRETSKTVWQITESHVHIEGNALLFKNISQESDDEKTRFKPLPGDISLGQAETVLLQQSE
jgi:hypothetical protein